MTYRFKAFKCLERLYYECGSATVGYAAFEPPRMIQVLQHLKPCLRDLTILADEHVGEYGSEFEDCPIGSLAGFEKLTSLDVTSYILIGSDPEDDDSDEDSASTSSEHLPRHQRLVDSLPPALKYLSLHNIEDHHVTHIFDLLTQKPSKTPHLKRLNLQWKGVTYPN
jgi:hypothetical protein